MTPEIVDREVEVERYEFRETGWRIDVAPMRLAELPQTARFIPLTVNLRLQAAGGAAVQFTTVRLVPRGGEPEAKGGE